MSSIRDEIVTAVDSLTEFTDVNILGSVMMDGHTVIDEGRNAFFESITSNVEVQLETLTVDDNKIVLNSNQVGTPDPALLSGIEVYRGGTEPKYEFKFRELDDTFVIGQTGDLQPVATRQDNPNSFGIPYWNAVNHTFETTGGATLNDQGGMTVNNLTVGNTIICASLSSGAAWIHSNRPMWISYSNGTGAMPALTLDNFRTTDSETSILYRHSDVDKAVIGYLGANDTGIFLFDCAQSEYRLFNKTTHTGISRALSVGVNHLSSIAGSAMLQVDSSDKGFLPPRVTSTNKAMISSPAAGLQVFDSTLNCLSVYNGSSWVNISGNYEAPLTFSTGLTRSANTISVNNALSISRLINVASNGFVKTTGGNGTLTIDPTNYVSADTSGNAFIDGRINTDGASRNILIGNNAGSAITTGTNNVIIGCDVAASTTRFSAMHLGNSAGFGITQSNYGLYIGNGADIKNQLIQGSFNDPNRHFSPAETNKVSLGTSSLRWDNFYARTGEFTSLGVGSAIILTADNEVQAHKLSASQSIVNTGVSSLIGNTMIGDAAEFISPSAILEVKSTNRGFLPPRLARSSIASPATGLIIYDTGVNMPMFYDGSKWLGFSPLVNQVVVRNPLAVNVTVNTTTWTSIYSYSYTPKFTGSTLVIEFDCSYYMPEGDGADNIESRFLIDGTTVVSQKIQAYYSLAGGGTRSGPMFPNKAAILHSGSNPTTRTINVQVARTFGDVSVQLYGSATTGRSSIFTVSEYLL